MEFLVIVLFVVAIVVVNFVVSRAQRRKKQGHGDVPDGGARQEQPRTAKQPKPPRKAVGAKAAPAAPRTSVAAAREANARLDAAQHQQVYAAIAQGRPIQAVKLYAQFTGVGVRAAGAAVENLATHPQPFQPPRPAAPVQETPSAPHETGNTPAGPGTDAEAPGTSRPAVPGADPDSSATPKNTAGPAEKPQSGPANKTPSTPEEDEISKWVKDLRPEDF